MLSQERKARILEFVDKKGSVTLEELAELLPVSKMTVWRDLKHLAEAGAVRRVHGGVVRVEPPEQRDFDTPGEPPFSAKTIQNYEEKRRIALFAAQTFVQSGDVVILEGGTTVMQIVAQIVEPNVTVVTHGLNTLVEASKRSSGLHVIGSGGILRDPSYTFVGPESVRFFENMAAQTLFLSGTGLDEEHGLTDPNPLEIEVKQAMIHAAQRVVLCMDSSKIGRRSFRTILPYSEIRTLVTGRDAPESFLVRARAGGMTVHLV